VRAAGCAPAGFVLAGACALAAAGAFGVLWLFLLATAPGDVGSSSIVGSLFWLAVFMSGALLAAGVPALARPLASVRVGGRGPGVWLLAFVVAVGIGQALLNAGGLVGSLLFPLVQVGAALAAALALVSTVSWRAGGEPATDVGAGLAYGGCIAASVALVLEGVAVMVAIVALFGVANLSGDAQELVTAVERALESAGPGGAVDPAMVADVVLQPALFVAALGVFGVAGPLIEELAKASGVAVRRPPSRYRAWFWGTAAGAGFGVTESVALGSMLTAGWVAGILIRAIAMIMHAGMSGLAGLGWHAAVTEQRRGAGLALVLIAIVGHMAWNTLVLGSVVAGIASAAFEQPGLMGVASAAIFGLIGLFVAIFLGFRLISQRLGAEEARARAPAALEPDYS
jgi:hypothetical protein